MAQHPKDADGKQKTAAREDRLKSALKANLARRKAQAKARAQTEPGDEEE